MNEKERRKPIVWLILFIIFAIMGPISIFYDFPEQSSDKEEVKEINEEYVMEEPDTTLISPDTKSIEEHAKLNNFNQPATPQFTKKVIEIAYATKKAIQESGIEEKTISLLDAKTIIEISGDEALLSTKEEGLIFVHHEGINMWMTIPHFIGYKNWYKNRGRDFFTAKVVPVIKPDGKVHIDASGTPAWTLDLMYDDVKLIYKKTGVWIDGNFFNRSENLRLVVWGRNLQQCLNTGGAINLLSKPGFLWSKYISKNDAKVLKKCSSAVREDVAAKPSNPGDGHAAIDIRNWKNKKVYNMLIDLGYTGGCKSKMWKPNNKGDGWHFSIMTAQASPEQEKKCLREEGLQ